MVYEGSAGAIQHMFNFGSSVMDPELFEFGQGTETDAAVENSVDGINGVRLLGTASADNDSVGRAWPAGFRPGITENGRLREANGSLVTKLRFGFPAITNRRFFFGIVPGAPSATYDVEDVFTVTAAGVITGVEADFAGFFYNSELTSNAAFWRTVATNTQDTDDDDALTTLPVKGATRYMNTSDPFLSPVLSVEVVFDGSVEFYFNGNLVRRIRNAVSPHRLYAPIFVMQSTTAGVRTVGVDYFCDEYARYVGPLSVA